MTATKAPVASQDTLDVSFQLVDVHGVEINVRVTFELLPVRRPVCCCDGKGAGKHEGQGRDRNTSAQVQKVRTTSVRERCRSCVHWSIQIQEMMMHHQQKPLVKRTCHGHEDCHTNRQRTRDWHTRLPTCHSELGVRAV